MYLLIKQARAIIIVLPTKVIIVLSTSTIVLPTTAIIVLPTNTTYLLYNIYILVRRKTYSPEYVVLHFYIHK